MSKKLYFIIFILSFIISSCVVNEQEFKRTQRNVNYLNTTTQTINKRLDNLEKKVSGLEEKIDKLDTTLKAEVRLKYNELLAEIKSLENQINDEKAFPNLSKNTSNNTVTEVTKEAIKDIYARLNVLEKQMQNLKSSKTVSNANTQEHSDKYFYSLAYNSFKNGKYSEAEKRFKEFIEKFPKSKLIPNAYYWLGETFYKRKIYEKAIINYDEVIVKYPKHNKVPAALLKEGMAFLKIGEKDGAKLIFKKIIKDFPKSPQAKYAKRYLSKIK